MFRKPSSNNFIVVHLDIALLISFGIATEILYCK